MGSTHALIVKGLHFVLEQGTAANSTCLHSLNSHMKHVMNMLSRMLHPHKHVHHLNPYFQVRKFGEYRCPQCGRTWSSGNSWVGMGQECMTCRIMVRPHTLRPLQRPDGHRDGPPHRSDLCEMCQKLGYNCRSKYTPARQPPQEDRNAACNIL